MKRTLILLLTILSFSQVNGQKIDSLRTAPPPPRKESLLDLPGKTTKVVLAEDNSILDLLFKDAVGKGWYISPFEFCSLEQFNKEKCDSNFYFLIRVKGMHRKEAEPAMEFVSLLKGSPKAEKDMNEMPDILTLPLSPTNDREGKAFSFLPSYIKIIQTHIQMIMDKNLNAYLGMSIYNDDIYKAGANKILFSLEDFAFPVKEEKLSKDYRGNARLVSRDEIEDAISEGLPNTLVPLILYPDKVQKGAYCYKMLINSGTQELVYFRKHKLTKKGKGFLKNDYRRMSIPFRNAK